MKQPADIPPARRAGSAERATADRPPQTEINWAGVLFGLCLAIFAAYQQLKLPPVLPILIADYGYGRILAGSFMSVYALLGLLLSLHLGNFMQRRGTAALLNLAFSLFAIAAAIMMLWPVSGWLFLFARAMEGVAFAILAIAGAAICTANAGTRGLAIASALIATWIPMGALIANLLAVGLVNWAGWRSLWAIGLVATGVMAFWAARIRGNPAVRLGAARDLLPPHAAAGRDRARTMIVGSCLFTLWSIQMFAYLTWVPDYLVSVYGYAPRTAALLFAVPMAVLTLFNIVAAPILRAGVPVALLLAASLGIQAAFWVLLPFLGQTAAAVGAFFVYAAAAGVTPTCLFALPGTIFGVERADSGTFGTLMTGRNLGVLLGPLLAGTLVQLSGGWSFVAPVLGLIGIVAVAGSIYLHRRLKRAGEPAAGPASVTD